MNDERQRMMNQDIEENEKECVAAGGNCRVKNLFAEGELKMPMLNLMGREKVTNSIKGVAMRILREDKSLGSTMGSDPIVLCKSPRKRKE